MADLTALLPRHQPLLRFDTQEAYFADSAAEWTDGPEQALKNNAGATLAAACPADGRARLSLAFLGAKTYANGTRVAPNDRIGCNGRDYVQQARKLHADPRYRNRIYGRSAAGGDGRTWLQYWFFYFYNDYNLIGPLLGAGLHEGDWEMVQLRLDAAEQAPDLAVYAQHTHAAAQPWARVERLGERPVVYPARGSHASYFAPGTHWTGYWFDHADGRGAVPAVQLEPAADDDPAYAWLQWPGYWGDTQPDGNPVSDASPTSPSRHSQWADPHKLLLTAEDYATYEPARAASKPTLPPAPRVSLTRAGTTLQVAYTCPGWPAGMTPAQLVVTLNSPREPLPPALHRVPIATPTGTADVPAGLHDDWAYDVTVSVVTTDGLASASTSAALAAT